MRREEGGTNHLVTGGEYLHNCGGSRSAWPVGTARLPDVSQYLRLERPS